MQDALPLSSPRESLALTSFTLHGLSLQLKDPEKVTHLAGQKAKRSSSFSLKTFSSWACSAIISVATLLAISFSVIPLLVFCYLLPAWNTETQEISAHSKQSHQHFRPTSPLSGWWQSLCNGNKAPFFKLSMPICAPSPCKQVCLSWQHVMHPSVTIRVAHQMHSALKHMVSTLQLRKELEIWELAVPSVPNQLALAPSQRHLGWCRGDGREQPGHRDQGQSKTGNTRCLLGFRAPADGNTYGIVAWLASTERNQLILFSFCAI